MDIWHLNLLLYLPHCNYANKSDGEKKILIRPSCKSSMSPQGLAQGLALTDDCFMKNERYRHQLSESIQW